MKDSTQTRGALRAFILENYLFTDEDGALKDGDSFLENKILDSMGILELTFFLADKFGVQVEDHEMVPENLDSIDNLVAFIARKKA